MAKRHHSSKRNRSFNLLNSVHGIIHLIISVFIVRTVSIELAF